MSAIDIKLLEDEICDRSDGNPGAINVMCAGVAHFGEDFYRAIEFRNLRGSQIWAFFKDENGEDIQRMCDSLRGGA